MAATSWLCFGCSDAPPENGGGAMASAGTTSNSTAGSGASGATTSGGGAGGAGMSGTTGATAGGGAAGASTANDACWKQLPIPPMPLISRGAPAFASGGDPKLANDDKPDSSWSTDKMPAWIAYDVSATPAAQRGQALISWYAIHAGCYIDSATPPTGSRPIAYALEANDGPGGGTPPDTGWRELVSNKANRYCGLQHLVDLKGANWVRMSVTETSGDSAGPAFDFDVQSAATGACDSWLFMGDSITYMSLTHAFCDLPGLVRAAKPSYWPAVLDAALGGTNTGTAMDVIDDTMKDFPGRFVVLAYGTNDGAMGLQMEGLVQKVIAAGKTPVVPYMPWSSGDAAKGAAINQQIEALYAKYPSIVKGPDLFAAFKDRLDLIPMGDVHPNDPGREDLRKQWATAMTAIYE
jgi:acyl-CoA thioesterase I